MSSYPKNCLLIAAITFIMTWSRASSIRVMNTSPPASSEECSDSGLLRRLDALSAWRQHIFKEADLEIILLRHNTANLSYIDRLELVNRVMVDVLLQAIPDNSAPGNETHVGPPLLAPRKGPAYRRKIIHNQNLSSNHSEFISFDVENQIDSNSLDETTPSSVFVNESSMTLNGEAHIVGISQASSGQSKTLKFPNSEIERHNKSAGGKNQEGIQRLVTVINDHERSTVKSNDDATSEPITSIYSAQNSSSSGNSREKLHFPIVKTSFPSVAQNSSYLSVFGKMASHEVQQNSSTPTPLNTVYFEHFPDDGVESSLAEPVKFISSVPVNASENGALANLPRDKASFERKQMGNFGIEKFGSVSNKNHLEGSEIGQPELEFPDNSSNFLTPKPKNMMDFSRNIFVQLNLSNLEAANPKCLMAFTLNNDEHTHSNLTLTQANFEACMTPKGQSLSLNVSMGWLKQVLMKIVKFLESNVGSFAQVLPRWNSQNNINNSTQAILFPTPNFVLSTQNSSLNVTNVTLPLEITGKDDKNSSSSFQDGQTLLNASENVAATQQAPRTSPQNSTLSGSRQPKIVSNYIIFDEIHARTNQSSGSSDGIFLNNYSQEGTKNTTTCALQTRWSKVEHLRRAVELLLLSVPVSLKEMMEASSYPFLEDFIFRPEGRSIFAVMSTCAKCYMKDPLGRCRQVLFCKNGATVSARILG